MKNKHIFLFISVFLFLASTSGISHIKSREGVVTIRINPNAPEDVENVKLWLPYPISDEHQKIEDIKIAGNYLKSDKYKEPQSNSVLLFAEWDKKSNNMALELKFKVKAEERAVKKLNETKKPIPADIKRYLEAEPFVPTDGKVKEIADDITKGKNEILSKARAVYDWVVENTHRDPDVKGCGLGIIEKTLAEGGGGKCADISTVFVALSRAAGVPAREVFGLRLSKNKEDDMTGGYHCWAEFYLPGTGWVPADPADVRKAMLEKNLDIEQAKPYKEYFFGRVDEYRIVLRKGGRGLTLNPPQSSGPVNYLMYPYAEVDGFPLDYFDPKSFKYSVHFKAL